MSIIIYGWAIDLWLIIVAGICIVGLIAFVVNRSVQAHRHQASAGKEEMAGKTAEVMIALEPRGIVFIQGERWTAVSETGRVEPGEEVIISRVDGLKLYVTKKQ